MAKAKLVTLADEVAAQVSTLLKVEATRTYKPTPKLEDTDQLTVLVGMPGSEMAPDSRANWVYEHAVEVGVMFRGGEHAGVPTEKFDECMKLVEEIADHYRFERPVISDMELNRVEFPLGAYILSHINEFNQFTGVVRLTFREWRT